jgi:hypothetical protein
LKHKLLMQRLQRRISAGNSGQIGEQCAPSQAFADQRGQIIAVTTSGVDMVKSEASRLPGGGVTDGENRHAECGFGKDSMPQGIRAGRHERIGAFGHRVGGWRYPEKRCNHGHMPCGFKSLRGPRTILKRPRDEDAHQT